MIAITRSLWDLLKRIGLGLVLAVAVFLAVLAGLGESEPE